MLSRLNILPRWIILLIDMCAVVVSIFSAYLLRFNFDVRQVLEQDFQYVLSLIIILNFIVFLTLRTYSGIVRYTGLRDSFRILVAVFLVNATLFTINWLDFVVREHMLIPASVIVINFLTSFLFLTSYRLVVKSIFDYSKELTTEKQNVLIFGAGQSGLITKKTIDQDSLSPYKIVGFIDDDTHKTNKKLDGIPIFNAQSDIEGIIKKYKIKYIIISVQNISPTRKNTIVDFCLTNNIKPLNVPPVKQWLNGQFKTKQLKDVKIEELLERDAINIRNDEITKDIAGKRILITGAAGSIGSEIVNQITKFNPQLIIACDQNETALHELELDLREKFADMNFSFFIGDVRNANRMEYLFNRYKPHVVYHAAAYKHVPMMENNPAEAVLTNVLGTKTVADISIKYGVDKFVMISTDKAVNPTNIMGASKRIAEIYTQALNKHIATSEEKHSGINSQLLKPTTKFITTRFGNVLGSNGSVIPRFKKQIEQGGPITVTHPDITRYFMTIPEACQLVLEAGCMGKGGEIYIFDMGKSVKIVDLAKKMIRLSGLEPNKDIPIVYTGLRPGEKLFEELLNDSENNIPTHHQKILIAKVHEYNFDSVYDDIDKLIDLARRYQKVSMVKLMKYIVPEFKSNNSIYQELDSLQSMDIL